MKLKVPTPMSPRQERSPSKLKTKVAPAIRKAQATAVDEEDPAAFEDTYVHSVYRDIAAHFARTRTVPWPIVRTFLSGLKEGALVLDAGCGNGKYLNLGATLDTGLDRCSSLCELAAARAPCVVGDVMALPFKGSAFDAVLSIAVLHHLSTPERRLVALRELYRVASPGAQVLVCVWAFEQSLEAQDSFVPWSREVGNAAHFGSEARAD